MRYQEERGVSIVFVAITIAVLFGFAAVAIDASGIGTNERRQSQSASDVGALAAVQFAQPVDMGNPACSTYSGLDLSRCNGATEAMAVANATLDDATLAVWADASRCATPPAGFTVSPITNCVAFTSGNQRAWVRIPTIPKPTTLARVIGIDTINITADAIAGTERFGGGAVLPFLLPGNAAGTDYNCLKTGPNPSFGACAPLPSVGNFGSMDFFLYGDESQGWTQKCNGDENGRLVANIARGVDHPLGLHPTGVGSGIEEAANCPDFNAEPNMAKGQPGVGSALEDGILYGDTAYAPSAYPGRIERSQADGGFKVRNPGGGNPAAWIDNAPLWAYLVANNVDIDGDGMGNDLLGTPCDDDDVDTPAEMDACIAWAKDTTKPGGATVIFNDDLRYAIRYGWTPSVWEPDFLGGSSQTYHIKLFLPVYIDTTFYGCNNNGCVIIHTPGIGDQGNCPNNPPESRITCGTPGQGNRSLEGVSAYILSQSIVPDNAKTPAPGDENQRTYNLTE